MAEIEKDPLTGAETTGHVWDETLKEFNNPLPRWWVWMFYASILFTVVYWLMYPAWPVGDSYTKGLNTVTFMSGEGDKAEEVTTHWNTRALLMKEMQESEPALKQQKYLKKVAATEYADMEKDQDMMAFVNSYGKGIFGDSCAACHQAGGQGVIGLFPNLVDDAWLWGGETADIETTIRQGRNGMMPAHKGSVDDTQTTQLAHYVLSLSGQEGTNPEMVTAGQGLFMSVGCAGCHMPTGQGMKALGSANLTDSIWTVANIPGADSLDAKVERISSVIQGGIARQMPAFNARLSDEEIKVLTAYINQLGG